MPVAAAAKRAWQEQALERCWPRRCQVAAEFARTRRRKHSCWQELQTASKETGLRLSSEQPRGAGGRQRRHRRAATVWQRRRLPPAALLCTMLPRPARLLSLPSRAKRAARPHAVLPNRKARARATQTLLPASRTHLNACRPPLAPHRPRSSSARSHGERCLSCGAGGVLSSQVPGLQGADRCRWEACTAAGEQQAAWQAALARPGGGLNPPLRHCNRHCLPLPAGTLRLGVQVEAPDFGQWWKWRHW